MFSLSEAAKQSGQAKSTIWRAIKSGRLSASRTDTGDYAIDPAELYRVYPPETIEARAAARAAKQDAMDPGRTETALLQAQIGSLRQIGEMLRNQLDESKLEREDLKKDRDGWRSQAERLLLTHGANSPPAEKTGWLRRLRRVV